MVYLETKADNLNQFPLVCNRSTPGNILSLETFSQETLDIAINRVFFCSAIKRFNTLIDYTSSLGEGVGKLYVEGSCDGRLLHDARWLFSCALVEM